MTQFDDGYNIDDPSSMLRQGFEISHTSISPVLSVEYPFQTPYRYFPVMAPKSTYSWLFKLPIRFWRVASISAGGQVMMFGAAAEDFTLSSFVGCPVMYPAPPRAFQVSGPIVDI